MTAVTTTVRVGSKKVNVSNLTKVLYPEAAFTKGDVVDYYARIAPAILPHLKGRPLTLKRYPNGVTAPYFYEKRCPSHRPDWVKMARVAGGESGWIDFCTVDDRATLIWVANLASLELHTMLCKAPRVETPTVIVFDLDPGPPAGIIDCIRVGLRMRETLEHLGLQSFPKTTGGNGLHLWVPLNTPVTFDQTKAFAHGLALLLEKDVPGEVVSKQNKVLRAGKVLVDWSQNDKSKTTAAAYSLRGRARPTVSTPVTWAELETALKKQDAGRVIFEAADVLRRVDKNGDLFAPVNKLRQKLPAL